jgi:hypothetical protein
MRANLAVKNLAPKRRSGHAIFTALASFGVEVSQIADVLARVDVMLVKTS